MEFTESRLLFSFDEDHWQIIQYDDQQGFYRENLLKAIPGTEGVDFIGIYQGQDLVFFEVKNFRGHRIENKNRLGNEAEELTSEIARKVRDTLSGILGGCRNDSQNEIWKHFAQVLVNSQKSIYIIAWVEEDSPPHRTQEAQKTINTVRRTKLKSKVSWLTIHATFQNVRTNTLKFDGFKCQFIAGS